jgi:hypothetical protein
MNGVTVINILTEEEIKKIQKENQTKILKSINNLLSEYGFELATITEDNFFIKVPNIKGEEVYIYPSNYDLDFYEMQFANLEHEEEYFNNSNYNEDKLGYYQVLSVLESLIYK